MNKQLLLSRQYSFFDKNSLFQGKNIQRLALCVNKNGEQYLMPIPLKPSTYSEDKRPVIPKLTDQVTGAKRRCGFVIFQSYLS
jgi:hypothetical protein